MKRKGLLLLSLFASDVLLEELPLRDLLLASLAHPASDSPEVPGGRQTAPYSPEFERTSS